MYRFLKIKIRRRNKKMKETRNEEMLNKFKKYVGRIYIKRIL
jgi:hypothetical protein